MLGRTETCFAFRAAGSVRHPHHNLRGGPISHDRGRLSTLGRELMK
jgi:hypothetical protein